MRVAIVGAGVAGLSLAYFLEKSAKFAQIPLSIELFDCGTRPGGMIESEAWDDCLLEHGPDAFITEKPAILELIQELGLHSDLIYTNSENRKTFIYADSKLHVVPKGFYLIAPLHLKGLMEFDLLSWKGKLRVVLEMLIPAKRNQTDESMKSFMERRFGKELTQKIAQPMIGGIYSSSLERLSLLATFSKFKKFEIENGSVTCGMRHQLKDKEVSGPRYQLFASFKEGMGQLVETLCQKLELTHLHDRSEVLEIKKEDSGWNLFFKQHPPQHGFDRVCLAIPAYQSAKILRPNFPQISEQLRKIRFESVSVVNFIYSKDILKEEQKGFGFVIPETEKLPILGCSYLGLKFKNRAPAHKTMIRVFLGPKIDRLREELSEEQIVKLIEEKLREILHYSPCSYEVKVRHYLQGMPQYEVGHLDRMIELEKKVVEIPGLFLAGNSYRGIGIPDTIELSKQIAQKILS